MADVNCALRLESYKTKGDIKGDGKYVTQVIEKIRDLLKIHELPVPLMGTSAGGGKYTAACFEKPPSEDSDPCKLCIYNGKINLPEAQKATEEVAKVLKESVSA